MCDFRGEIMPGESLPSRGAWIEIETALGMAVRLRMSRSPHGERGLKLVTSSLYVSCKICRSPHGERGLK